MQKEKVILKFLSSSFVREENIHINCLLILLQFCFFGYKSMFRAETWDVSILPDKVLSLTKIYIREFFSNQIVTNDISSTIFLVLPLDSQMTKA